MGVACLRGWESAAASPSTWAWLPALSVILAAAFSCLVPTADAASVYIGADSAQGELLTAYSTAYQYAKDSVSINFNLHAGLSASLPFFTAQGVSYVLAAPLSDDVPASVKALHLFQIPYLGSAMVMGYNLPDLAVGDPALVLSGEVLAHIYLGNISMWNDSAIEALNPDLALANKLPAEPIKLVYYPDTAIQVTKVFSSMLSKMSSDFEGTFNSVGRNFSRLLPAYEGRMHVVTSHSLQASYVASTAYSLGFMEHNFAINANVKYSLMVNKEGYIVSPTVHAIRAAMDGTEDTSGSFAIDLTDASGSDSWPLSYIQYVTLIPNLRNPGVGCTSTQELLSILVWAQTNSKAIELANQHNFATLSVPKFRRMLDALPHVSCNGRSSFASAAVMGVGAPIQVYPSWANEISSSNRIVKYYSGNNEEGIRYLTQQHTDFGGIDRELTDQEKAEISDLLSIPMVAYAIAPAYSIPSILPFGLLNFSLPLIADIYLGNIRDWNDSRIKALNPVMAPYLPSAQICVIYSSDPSEVTHLWTTVLAENSAEFASEYTPGPLINFQNLNNCSMAVPGNIIPSFAQLNSFGMWILPDIFASTAAKPGYMFNAFGNRVAPLPSHNVRLALLDYDNPLLDDEAILYLTGLGNLSWPFATGSAMIMRANHQSNCVAISALTDWIWWIQTDAIAAELAENYGMATASQHPNIRRRILNTLASIKCQGRPSFSKAGCVKNGTLCSDLGDCENGTCRCYSGYEGTFCEQTVSSSSSLSTGATIGIVLGVLLPVALCLLLVSPILVTALVLLCLRSKMQRADWEISTSELDISEQLGMGSYGTVHRAMWRGTEVAVKLISIDATGEAARNFKKEVHMVMSLRHPNVVLFMAASTKPDAMCLVMEYMAMGSMFDVISNELIPDISIMRKYKMACQAARGMHFLHSAGIVHRDLKSLNLLIDKQWNVKVSDFGLTRLKEEVAKGKDKGGMGSIFWMAPEVLNAEQNIDFALADVYSYGIILWELLTRCHPYPGMSPAAVAVAVIRDDARPEVPQEVTGPIECHSEYYELMQSCWHRDPSVRPTFLEVVTRLSSLAGEEVATSQADSEIASGEGSVSSMQSARHRPPLMRTRSTGATTENYYNHKVGNLTTDDFAAVPVPPPKGEVTIVFTDITSAASLWEFNAPSMKDATLIHNQVLRNLLSKYRGYETRPVRDRNAGEGSFCIAFQDSVDALEWCMDAQRSLLGVEWPAALLEHPGAAEEWGDTDDRVLFKGLRVRMGVHVGEARATKDPLTRRWEYFGPPVNAAARITSMAHGGQIVISYAVQKKIMDHPLATEKNRILSLGKFELPDSPGGYGYLYELKVRGLEGRFFGGVHSRAFEAVSQAGTSLRSEEDDDEPVQTAVGDLLSKEDQYLTSANLCRWVINFSDVQLEKQIGVGSYGVVYKAMWKGVEVAVKRFIKQNMNERSLLEFRAEIAFLSEMHHPNIVLFIGACVRMPNLCLVMEFMGRGSLKDILADKSIKLTWKKKLQLLKSAALGVNYLHSLQPCIIHRDLKSANLLVDENWNVKISDFGFARIKEENVTMTRCGSPCWTAPELIRGERYSEKVDIYSFGIVMWEVLTRRVPYAGRNFMGVALDVLEGKRPIIPADCPPSFADMLERCWSADSDRRPNIEELIGFLTSILGEAAEGFDI